MEWAEIADDRASHPSVWAVCARQGRRRPDFFALGGTASPPFARCAGTQDGALDGAAGGAVKDWAEMG